MRPKTLNLVHTWTIGGCIMYTGIRLLLLIHPFVSSFFFLSSFQTLKMFVAFFSGIVRPRRLKIGTCMNSGWMYHVYQNQMLLLICPFIFSFFFLSNFRTLKIFVALFSGTVRHIKLKLGTHGQWVDASCIPKSGCCFLFVPLFLHFSFSTIFKHEKFSSYILSGTVRPK